MPKTSLQFLLPALCALALLPLTTPALADPNDRPPPSAAEAVDLSANTAPVFGPTFQDQTKTKSAQSLPAPQQSPDDSTTTNNPKASRSGGRSLPASELQSLPAIEQQPLGTPDPRPQQKTSPLSRFSVIGQTLIALLLVITLAVGLRHFMRYVAKRSGSVAGQLTAGGKSPSGVLSILGRYPVARGQTLVLLKLDRRILLLCQTPAGFSTLTSIDDPDEVASILTRTEDDQGASMTQKFREALHLAERDPSVSGNGTLELPDDHFQLNTDQSTTEQPNIHVAMDPIASLKRRLEQLGGTSA